MGKMVSLVASAWLITGLSVGSVTPVIAAEHSNPVDIVSNPEARDFSNAEVALQELDEPFIRYGAFTDPQLFTSIHSGVSQAQVRSTLGEPLKRKGSQWEYNFQFRLEQSQNFIVCQYKVLFDNQGLVKDTVWRRRQCQQLVPTS